MKLTIQIMSLVVLFAAGVFFIKKLTSTSDTPEQAHHQTEGPVMKTSMGGHSAASPKKPAMPVEKKKSAGTVSAESDEPLSNTGPMKAVKAAKAMPPSVESGPPAVAAAVDSKETKAVVETPDEAEPVDTTKEYDDGLLAAKDEDEILDRLDNSHRAPRSRAVSAQSGKGMDEVKKGYLNIADEISAAL